ncbi:hypothetical protein Tco_1250894, partial [Tanacetum coccineum]
EHEEMRAFISKFRTTNELLFKERNNLLNKLRFEVHGLSKIIDNALMSNSKVKGVTTGGGTRQLKVEKRERRSSAMKVLRKPKATPYQFVVHRSPSSNAKVRQISEKSADK